ncbi:uncharacterized protein LOC117162954 [Bombus vancouverensis nearcticus]|uniref:uncharacterized protein LOC117162954 n=1 Tax=Bombus vancouverensis nearcticus TaxID=2705178 RepID=UPI001438F901|nr:uncharacterized protein LOC117162954 [Bombus vancouverensis nearcticus]XP_033200830.1 uncharacterized protein LOC117162954 [Bombus vancouverensis nearcticus]
MEKLTHLWNVNQFITKLNCSQSRNLQTFYIERCKQYTHGIQPSSQNFGPSVMCPYCGSLWNTIDHSIRLSRGKPLSKSIKKIVHSMNNGKKRIPEVQRSLAEKCLKNKMNKLVLKCSVCSKSTRISFNKPQREKVQKIRTESIERSKKRKKKRTKDRTAGLNVSGISNLNEKNVQTEELKETNIKKVRSTANFITPTQQKIKMINIDRLKNIINQGATPPKRKSLHSFLTELC